MAPPFDSPDQSDPNSLLQPYQSQAEKMFPTNPMAGLSQKFATNHPMISGIMGNMLLAASQSGTGRTVGESIGIAGRMAMAPEQFKTNALRQQNQYETGMATQAYQRGMQDRNWQEELRMHNATISNFKSEADHRDAMEDIARRTKTVGGLQFEGSGVPWVTTMGQDGIPHLTNVYTGQKADELPPDQRPNIDPQYGKRDPTPQSLGPEGNVAMNTFLGTHKRAPVSAEDWTEIGTHMENLKAQGAGARTGATDVAGQPKRTAEALIAEARTTATKDIEPPAFEPKAGWDYYMLNTGKFKSPEEAEADLVKQHSDYRAKMAKANDSVAKFTASGAANQGIDYTTWKQQQDSGSPQKVPPAAPANSGSKWQPK